MEMKQNIQNKIRHQGTDKSRNTNLFPEINGKQCLPSCITSFWRWLFSIELKFTFSNKMGGGTPPWKIPNISQDLHFLFSVSLA